MNTIYRIVAATLSGCVTLAPLLTASAETITRKQATRMAQDFFNQAAGQVTAPVRQVYDGRRLTTQRLFPPFYVFNHPAGGFVIISAENKARPILGYSFTTPFSPDHISDRMKAVLTSLAHDIEMIRYDSRIPEEAIAAWTDWPGYLTGVLESRPVYESPGMTPQEAGELINSLVLTDDYDASMSDIYTPAQWSTLVAEELRRNHSVALGFIGNGDVTPVVVYGKRGDFFRLLPEEEGDVVLALQATEYMSSHMIASLASTPPLPPAVEEDPPFLFHDSFAAGTRAIDSDPADMMRPGVPQLIASGAHYEIRMPEPAVSAAVYNLGGAPVLRLSYDKADVVNFSLDREPTGFYFVQITGASGTPYGLKLIR